uniref:G protein-coupled receptor n=1 Tax=Ditylenchus dipsaci TaxID=166011 RepID=A0A915D1K9_9BILA
MQIRTIRALSVLAFVTAIRNFITVGILLLILFYYTPMCLFEAAQFQSHLFDITVALYSSLFPLALIVVHPELRRSIERFINFPLNYTTEPMNAIGERLILRKAQTDHFAILKKQWEAKIV